MSCQWNYPPETVRDRYLRLALHGRVQGKFGFPNPPLLPPQIHHRIPMRNDPSSPVPSVRSRDSQAPVPIACVPRCFQCHFGDMGNPSPSTNDCSANLARLAIYLFCPNSHFAADFTRVSYVWKNWQSDYSAGKNLDF